MHMFFELVIFNQNVITQPEMTDCFVVILHKPFPFLQSTANLHSDLLPFN